MASLCSWSPHKSLSFLNTKSTTTPHSREHAGKHGDVIKWKHFSRYWPFVRGIHRSPVNSPHKGQGRGALLFSLICALNKRLSKQSWCWWFKTPSHPLWRHCNVTPQIKAILWTIICWAFDFSLLGIMSPFHCSWLQVIQLTLVSQNQEKETQHARKYMHLCISVSRKYRY